MARFRIEPELPSAIEFDGVSQRWTGGNGEQGGGYAAPDALASAAWCAAVMSEEFTLIVMTDGAAMNEQAVVEVRAALRTVARFPFDKALRATTVFSQARERSQTTIIAAVHGARCAQAVLAGRIAERGGPAQRQTECP